MKEKTLSRHWLLLGCAALAIAGLYSLALVAARTPALASLPFFSGFFHAALVAHVDLSVLAWFLCIAGLMWSELAPGKRRFMPYVEEAALIAMALAILAITLSPLVGGVPVMMSNYIPVIHSPVFFLGLALMLCAAGIMAIATVASKENSQSLATGHWSLATYLSAGIALIAIFAFVLAHRLMPPEIDGQQYYELLFWGGGHTLQYLYAQLMMVAWLLLVMSGECRVPSKILWLLLSILPLLALATPFAYLLYDVHIQEHRQFFTYAMMASGIAPGLLALWVLPEIWRNRGRRDALWAALAMSLLLFLYGGALGGLIDGQNVVIPAHYHGSIVGVTLAFMGLAYLKLPQFGYRDPVAWKMAYWQPIVYGIGQILHISGLAYSGGYGVLRKTPGEIVDISFSVKMALGVMGLGGLIAIIGGLMFVIVVGRAVFYKD